MSGSCTGDRDKQPLVALICTAPLLGEALADALETIAEVRRFPAGRGDTAGLLRWLEPDAIVVDSDEEAEQASAFARERNSPLLFVSDGTRRIRLLSARGWEEPENGASAETLRNILVGAIFGRGRRR